MDYRELERRLSGYTLRFYRVRDRAVEYARFPSMAAIYKSMIDADGMPPTQEAFARAVAAEVPTLPLTAVMARACRTYPSLVRQQHFEMVLRSNFANVIADPNLDMVGVDFVVVEGGQWYGIGLSTDTEASHEWKHVKEGRHKRPPFPVLDLYVEPNAYRVGDFWLHTPEHVEEIRAFIERCIGV